MLSPEVACLILSGEARHFHPKTHPSLGSPFVSARVRSDELSAGRKERAPTRTIGVYMRKRRDGSLSPRFGGRSQYRRLPHQPLAPASLLSNFPFAFSPFRAFA